MHFVTTASFWAHFLWEEAIEFCSKIINETFLSGMCCEILKNRENFAPSQWKRSLKKGSVELFVAWINCIFMRSGIDVEKWNFKVENMSLSPNATECNLLMQQKVIESFFSRFWFHWLGAKMSWSENEFKS